MKVRKAYQWLVDMGCVVVIGPFISENLVNLRYTINASGVACLGWTGTTRFYGEHCLTVPNGDIPTEGVKPRTDASSRGQGKVGFFWQLYFRRPPAVALQYQVSPA